MASCATSPPSQPVPCRTLPACRTPVTSQRRFNVAGTHGPWSGNQGRLSCAPSGGPVEAVSLSTLAGRGVACGTSTRTRAETMFLALHTDQHGIARWWRRRIAQSTQCTITSVTTHDASCEALARLSVGPGLRAVKGSPATKPPSLDLECSCRLRRCTEPRRRHTQPG